MRQNVQRIDHIVVLVHEEHLEAAVATFNRLLGIEVTGPHEFSGLRVYVDWESGIEILAPFDRVAAAERFAFLERNGEGIFRLVFGVASRQEAVDRARRLGIGHVLVDGFDVTPTWRERFVRVDEAPLTTYVHGVPLNFGEIVPRDPEPEGNGQHVQRIDHVVFCVHHENLTSAVAAFGELLDIELEGPVRVAGVEAYVAWDAGIEIQAPVDPTTATAQAHFLAERGEGIFRLAFGVADRAAAAERAQEIGVGAVFVDGSQAHPGWSDRFRRLDEALLTEPVHGVRLSFSQIEPVARGS